MKPIYFLFGALALTFVACENDHEFATPVSDLNQGTLVDNSVIPQDNAGASAACQDIATSHALTGYGRRVDGFIASPDASRGVFEITGTGTASSNELQNGKSTIRFVYNARTLVVSGTLQTRFVNGATLNQRFNAVAERTVEGSVTYLKLSLLSADLTVDADLMDFNGGIIQIAIPSVPVGNQIQIQAQTLGSYCPTE